MQSRIKGLEKKTRQRLRQVRRYAAELGHAEVGCEHLLAVLYREDLLTFRRIEDALIAMKGKGTARTRMGQIRFTPGLTAVMEACAAHETVLCGAPASPELLLQFIQQKDAAATLFMKELGLPVRPQVLPRAELRQTPPPPKNKGLERYARNMTQAAAQGKLSPCFGREEELERLICILCRKYKNNPCLVGEPGVGKTAIVEGLALRMAAGLVPEALRHKQVYALDMSSVVAGTKYRGDFEERLRQLLEEASAGKGVVLFVDEMHTLVGAGAAEGAIDAANILKPVLARGEVQMIGATTLAEYRKSVEKDAALERRFQKVLVEEPSTESCLTVLRGLRPGLEGFHGLKVADDALYASVECSQRYLSGRFLPDKAIDLLDESAAVAAVAGKKQLTHREIEKTVSKWTGIPETEVSADELRRIGTLQSALESRVAGQREAVYAVAQAVARTRMGLGTAGRPGGCFLFSGPTGVGKTFLAKELARVLFGKRQAVIRLDMSEYAEPAAVSKLLGAPPGYVGHDEPSGLIEQIRQKPYSLVLFDELEKADPAVRRLLLQIMEEGSLTASDGRKGDFTHALLIATTNAGAGSRGPLGFVDVRSDALSGLAGVFSPELLGRFDAVIRFSDLDEKALTQIAAHMLDELREKLRGWQVVFSYEAQACEMLARRCQKSAFGARPLRKELQTAVENPLCAMRLNGTINPKDALRLTVKDNELFLLPDNEAKVTVLAAMPG